MGKHREKPTKKEENMERCVCAKEQKIRKWLCGERCLYIFYGTGENNYKLLLKKHIKIWFLLNAFYKLYIL